MPFSNVKLFYAGHTTFSTPFCVLEEVIKTFQEFKATLFVDLELKSLLYTTVLNDVTAAFSVFSQLPAVKKPKKCAAVKSYFIRSSDFSATNILQGGI